MNRELRDFRKTSQYHRARLTGWIGLGLVAVNAILVISIVTGVIESEESMALLSSRLDIDCVKSWPNASIGYREEVALVSIVTLKSTFLIMLAVFSSALLRRDIAERGPGSAAPIAKTLIGLFLIYIWICDLGREVPANSITDLTTVTKAFLNHPIGIVLASFVSTMLARQVGADGARVILKSRIHGWIEDESNGRR